MKKKFTLIELIIVIVVIGLLTAMALPKVTGIIQNAKISAMINDKEVLEKAILLYYQKYDNFPLLNEGQELIISNNGISLIKMVQAEEVVSEDMKTIYTSLQETLKHNNDSEESLYRIDLSKTNPLLSKSLKYGHKKTDKDFYVYSTKTNNVYYYNTMINGDGEIQHSEFNTTLKESELVNKKFSYNLSEDNSTINSKPIVELTTNLSNITMNSIIKWEYKFIDEDKTPTKISFILNDVEYNDFNNIPTQLEEGEYTLVLEMQDSKGLWSNQIVEIFTVESNVNVKINNIELSEFHSMKIGDDGKLYSWGYNFFGQLCLGHKIQQTTPQLVTLPNEEKPSSISLGNGFSMIISDKGNLYSCGNNFFGQLGIGTTTFSETKIQLVTLPNKEKPISISSRNNHTIVSTDKGNLYSWGTNAEGQLGIGNTTHQSTPQKITIPNKEKPIFIDTGINYSMIITDKGNLYAWGHNIRGELGIGNTIQQTTPQLVNLPNEEKPISISLGNRHSTVITDKGNLYSCGSAGQLGTGNNLEQSTPQLVNLPNGEKPISISSGGNHSIVITDKGNLYAWGKNTNGQLGTGNTIDQLLPTHIILPNNEKAIFINTGTDYSIATTNKGNFYFWGKNTEGQLGIGNTIDQLTPIKVELP